MFSLLCPIYKRDSPSQEQFFPILCTETLVPLEPVITTLLEGLPKPTSGYPHLKDARFACSA